MRQSPLLYNATAEDLIDGDLVRYRCVACGMTWALTPSEIRAHPGGGPQHRLRDYSITACGRCGEDRAIFVSPEYVDEP